MHGSAVDTNGLSFQTPTHAPMLLGCLAFAGCLLFWGVETLEKSTVKKKKKGRKDESKKERKGGKDRKRRNQKLGKMNGVRQNMKARERESVCACV